MKSLLTKIRIPALSFIILILLFFIGSTTSPAPALTPEPKLEPTVTSSTDKLKVHFIKTTKMCDAILIDLGEVKQ